MKSAQFIFAMVTVAVVGAGLVEVPAAQAGQSDLGPAGGFDNPLRTGDKDPDEVIRGLVTNITTFFLGLVGTLALLAIIWGATLIILGLGDEQRVSQGKKIIFWALAGVLIAGLAAAIVWTVWSWLSGSPAA